MKKRIFAVLLCVCLLVGLLPTTAFAAGTDTGKAIQLGTGGISGWDSTNGYDYIYFGNWTVTNDYTTSGPIKWRVLDTKTNMENATEGNGLFLLSDALYATWLDVTFQESYHTYNNICHKGSEPSDDDHTDCLMMNAWQGSEAQEWCNDFYSKYLTTQEQNAVLATTKSDEEFTITITNTYFTYQRKFDASNDILSEDKVFFLSVEEAKNENYGFTDDDARSASYDDTAYWYNFWWLRSPSASADNYAGIVRYDGSVNTDLASFKRAARPAFNLNPNAVLFISAAAGGKADTAVDGSLMAVGTAGTDWKLTLKDDSRNFTATPATATIEAGQSLSIDYSGAQTGTNEYVSAMIAQGDTILYYGRIAQSSESGTASVTIPSGLATGSYTLKVFSEQYNGDQKTDYASDFVDISLSVTGSTTPPDPPDPDTTAPKLTEGDATRTSEANATVKFTSSEAGTYYYAVVESGSTVPSSSELISNGTNGSCVSGENTISVSGLADTAAKDIYIVVQDAAGNVSDTLQITIPAYTAPSYSISASPESYDFGNLNEGYTAPSAQTITITNESPYLVTLTQPTASYFEIGTLSKTDLSTGETATFTVQPKTGYAEGTYSETITVTGSLYPVDIGGGGIEPWKPGGDTGGNAELTSMTYYAANAITTNSQTENTITASLNVSFTVSAPPSTDTGVTAVSVDGVAGRISGTTITVELPHNTTPPTDSSKISITLPDGATKTTPTTSDNGATWTFTVTAEDGSTQETYTINVSVNGTHSYGDWQSDGQTHWKECACGHREEAAHSATDDGDCTTAVTCAVCGYVTKAAETSHSFTSYVSNNDATCTADGTKTAKCDHDGCDKADTQTDSGSAGHTFGDWITVTSPTCTDKGAQQRTCSVCDFKETQDVNPNGHAWEDDYTVDKAATCTEDGSKSIHCKNCDVVKDSEVIPALGHKAEEIPAVAATCTEAGATAGEKCSVCGEILKEPETIPAKGHTTVEIPAVAATCTEAGATAGEKCLVCGEYVIAPEVIPAKGHTTVEIPAVAATCTEAGATAGEKCTVCSAITVEPQVIAAKGHTWDDGKVTKKPTLTDEGSMTYTCTVCGETKVETIEKLSVCDGGKDCPAYSYADVIKEAWYHLSVDYVIENKLMIGYTDGSFRPENDLTRAEMVKIIYNWAGMPAVSGTPEYPDVVEDAWFTDAIIWATQNGVVEGYDNGNFGPNDKVTREQLAAMLYRYAGEPDVHGSLSKFKDADTASAYAEDALKWAVEQGILEGYTDDTLRPIRYATRAEIATMLKRYIEE